jgi:uracil-DNA glycosylase
MTMKLEASWHGVLKEEIAQPYVQELKAFLERERASHLIYPPEQLVFNAFSHTPFAKVKVVIMGQDPYHGPGQAHGLCFSVPEGIDPPPSLQNIFKELESDVGIKKPTHGCLTSWADQGVLLLNATLTVRAGQAKSHYGKGWERFTDAVVSALLKREKPLIFLLWGNSAKEKYDRLMHGKKTHHVVLMAPHPSPLSAYAGFFGCRHFSQVNEQLRKWGQAAINWQI